MLLSWVRRARVRWGVVALALLLLMGLAHYWKTKAESSPFSRSEPVTVPTAVASIADVKASLRVSGSVAALNSVYLLAPRILGSRTGFNRGGDTNFGGGGGGGGSDFNLVLLTVAKAGTRVEAGDVVGQFDPQNQIQRFDDYKDTVIQLENNLKSATASLAALLETHAQSVRGAKANWDKAALDLKTTPVQNPIDAERLKLAVEEAEATYRQLAHEESLVEESQRAQLRVLALNLEQSRIEAKRAETNVQKMTIKAPIRGFVVMASIVRNGEFGQVREGDQINAGQPFVSIVDPASMVLNGTLNQVDAEMLRLGMKAVIHVDAYPEVELPATVTAVGAMSVASTFRANYVGETPIRLRIDAADARLLPDLTGSAEVVLQSEANVVSVPAQAVFQDNGPPFVYLKTQEGWIKRPVQLGLESHTSAAIRSGLQRGDVVATQRPEAEQVSSASK
jgi:multidrug resistance efflux pump